MYQKVWGTVVFSIMFVKVKKKVTATEDIDGVSSAFCLSFSQSTSWGVGSEWAVGLKKLQKNSVVPRGAWEHKSKWKGEIYEN